MWAAVDTDKCTIRGQVSLCEVYNEWDVPCLEQGEGFNRSKMSSTSCATEIKEVPPGVLVNVLEDVQIAGSNQSQLERVGIKTTTAMRNFPTWTN
jgi:hypothetical protein